MQKQTVPLPVGIVSYGTYVPKGRVRSTTIDAAHGRVSDSLLATAPYTQKSVPDSDEDAVTLSVQAGSQAIARTKIPAQAIKALFIGSESHPYAVKPTGTVVASALGLSEEVSLADLEFACKAGTQALQIVQAYVQSGMIEYGLAMGSDTAQAAPGDALEYTAAAGSAAYVLGSEQVLVEVVDSVSVATDTPDFWRAAGAPVPQHAGRFTGEPAYFYHSTASVERLYKKTGITTRDIDYCVFHTPNGKFPRQVAARLGFSAAQIEPSLVVEEIGNTYSAAGLLALAHLLDQVAANKTILFASYGSGAGSDAFLLRTTALLPKKRSEWTDFVSDYSKNTQELTYTEYQKRTTGSH